MRARPLAFCLALSGAAALIDEVVWFRELSLVMGHTAYALAALLTAFLGGLAAGAYLAGRWVDRRGATVRQYAAIEIVVALTAPAVPLVLRLFDPAFGAAYRAFGDGLATHSLAQFVLCALVLFVPTVAMGMTLPVLLAVVAPDDRGIESDTSLFYALNAFGGVAGATLAGLVLLPRLGAQSTLYVAAGLNLAAAAIAFGLRGASPSERATEAPREHSWPAPRGLAVLYGLAGFSALALQVGWARVVTLSVGSTVYGFTITLATFVFGIAAGSLAVARIRYLVVEPVRALFALHATIALWTIASLPHLGTLPSRVAAIMGTTYGFYGVWAAELGVVATTILVPTLAMGAIFPLVAELLRREQRSSGRAVGVAYASNTLGSIVGSMAAGFVFVPWLGMRGTIVLSAALSAALAIAYLPSAKRLVLGGLLAAVVAGAAFIMPAWDRDLLTSAPFGKSAQVGAQIGERIAYVEGPTTVASVRRAPNGIRVLYSGGVLESLSGGNAHRYLAHQALLLHASAQRVLVVGLGAGYTLEAALDHPVAQVDCVEIAPEIVALTREHFATEALADPRTHVWVADGRTHLRHADETYDVIASQPSYPWMAGAASLFTREYFAAMRERLAPGGVAVIWFPGTDDRAARSVFAAWRSVFDNAYRFAPAYGNEVHYLVGINGAEPIDPRFVRYAFQTERADKGAEAAGIPDAETLLGRIRPWPEARDDDPPANTDDNAYVEHRAFRALVEDR